MLWEFIGNLAGILSFPGGNLRKSIGRKNFSNGTNRQIRGIIVESRKTQSTFRTMGNHFVLEGKGIPVDGTDSVELCENSIDP